MSAVSWKLIVGNETYLGSASYTEHTKQEIVVTTGTTDSSLNFGGVTTADVLLLYSDQALTVNLNSSAGTDITVDANKPMIISGGAVTAVYVSNSSGSSANILFEIWGA